MIGRWDANEIGSFSDIFQGRCGGKIRGLEAGVPKIGLFSMPVSRYADEGSPSALHRSMLWHVLYRTAIARPDDTKIWRRGSHTTRCRFSRFRVFRPISRPSVRLLSRSSGFEWSPSIAHVICYQSKALGWADMEMGWYGRHSCVGSARMVRKPPLILGKVPNSTIFWLRDTPLWHDTPSPPPVTPPPSCRTHATMVGAVYGV
jgi:hypothetical protein